MFALKWTWKKFRRCQDQSMINFVVMTELLYKVGCDKSENWEGGLAVKWEIKIIYLSGFVHT